MMSEIMVPSGVAGNAVTVKHMWRLINQDTKDESMINIATAIIRTSNSNDLFAQANALFDWVHKSILYINNPTGVQMIQDPFRTIERRAGACTDQSILIGAMAQAVGFPVRLKTIKNEAPKEGEEAEFSHIYPQLYINGRWISADTTVPESYLGWEGPALYGEGIWENPLFGAIMKGLGWGARVTATGVDIMGYLNSLINSLNTPIPLRNANQNTLINNYAGTNANQVNGVLSLDSNTKLSSTIPRSYFGYGWMVLESDIPQAKSLVTQVLSLIAQEPAKAEAEQLIINQKTISDQKKTINELNDNLKKQLDTNNDIIPKINGVNTQIIDYRNKGIVLSDTGDTSNPGSIKILSGAPSENPDLVQQVNENNQEIEFLKKHLSDNGVILRAYFDMLSTNSALLEKYKSASEQAVQAVPVSETIPVQESVVVPPDENTTTPPVAANTGLNIPVSQYGEPGLTAPAESPTEKIQQEAPAVQPGKNNTVKYIIVGSGIVIVTAIGFFIYKVSKNKKRRISA